MYCVHPDQQHAANTDQTGCDLQQAASTPHLGAIIVRDQMWRKCDILPRLVHRSRTALAAVARPRHRHATAATWRVRSSTPGAVLLARLQTRRRLRHSHRRLLLCDGIDEKKAVSVFRHFAGQIFPVSTRGIPAGSASGVKAESRGRDDNGMENHSFPAALRIYCGCKIVCSGECPNSSRYLAGGTRAVEETTAAAAGVVVCWCHG